MNNFVDMSIDNYHAHSAISRSALLEFKRSPLHFWHKYVNPDYRNQADVEIITNRNAREFGNAAHTYILERNEFESRYIEWAGPSRGTKAGKEAFKQIKGEAHGRHIINQDAVRQIERMSVAVDASPEATALLKNGLAEKSIFYRDKITGLELKARPDVIHSDFLVDLKCVANASLHAFEKSVYEYGYHIQAAMQLEALEAETGREVTDFLFVPIEKDAPHAMGIYPLSQAALDAGEEELYNLTKRLKKCFDENSWPSYQTDYASLPVWAINRINEQLNKV